MRPYLLWVISVWLAVDANAAVLPPLLKFDKAKNQMEARIDGWSLRRFLDRLASVTGWQVFVEPGTERRVSSSFQSLETREALQRLLGDLSFALIRPTNAPTRLLIYRTDQGQASLKITGADASGTPGLLDDELIVTLKPGGASIDELARKLGAKVIGRADNQHAYRLKFNDAEAAREARSTLLDSPDVASVDDNYQINRPITADAAAAAGFPSLNLTPTSRADGSHLIVGLVDTAVQTSGTGLKDFLLNPLSVAGESNASKSEPTHGTSMAETILRGLSSGAGDSSTPVRLLPVDVYGAGENTTSFDVARGIYAAIKDGATVINLSLGSSGDSGFLRNVISQGDQQGIIFIAAAGNEPTTSPTYPAAYPEVIAVTASDRQGNIASYANRGDFVDVIAPGGNVIQFAGQTYYGVGTSFSTAYVSGAAAGLAANGQRTAAQIREQILQSLKLRKNP